ncbi:hypothetical protein EYF80_056209 [Liparis tanakae]|uniref:Uncharacterized protein n=1 Tax=Liparis tanakae TaxID=230148 RepID=A0A4Z2EXR5_9TELE|nr:hypothetical protein EYF80_056209 [Liparis tanakae]
MHELRPGCARRPVVVVTRGVCGNQHVYTHEHKQQGLEEAGPLQGVMVPGIQERDAPPLMYSLHCVFMLMNLQLDV